MSTTFVAAVTTTYGRPAEIRRLLLSLAESDRKPDAVFICDNSGDLESRDLPLSPVILKPGRNLGCGGGLRIAEQEAIRVHGSRLTHLWVLDDDVTVEPETLSLLLAALDRHQGVAAVPAILNSEKKPLWLPGLKKIPLKKLQNVPDLRALRAALPPQPLTFSWSQGICFLVSKKALDHAGLHRGDFWIRGEDLDFSLRVTACGAGLFCPEAVAYHLPPPGSNPADAETAKHVAMIQNIAYLAIHTPHGRVLLRHLPGNILRFVQTWRSPGAICLLMAALLNGGIRGFPAGKTRLG